MSRITQINKTLYICIFVGITVFSSIPNADTIDDIQLKTQQASLWCWAATAQEILNYYGIYTSDSSGSVACKNFAEQCKILTEFDSRFEEDVCCNKSSCSLQNNDFCNAGLYIDQTFGCMSFCSNGYDLIFDRWGVEGECIDNICRTLTMSEMDTQVSKKQPWIMGLRTVFNTRHAGHGGDGKIQTTTGKFMSPRNLSRKEVSKNLKWVSLGGCETAADNRGANWMKAIGKNVLFQGWEKKRYTSIQAKDFLTTTTGDFDRSHEGIMPEMEMRDYMLMLQ